MALRREDGVTDERSVISARVSPESKDGWELWAAENGVTLSALLEVIGRSLLDPIARGHWRSDDLTLDLVEQARQVDNERRKRAPSEE